MVYVGDGATSTGAFHEGINFAAVQRCPLVVIVENNRYAYSTPTSPADRREVVRRQGRRLRRRGRAGGRQRRAGRLRRRARAVDRARAGEGVTLIEVLTYRRKGHAQHDPRRTSRSRRDRALGHRPTTRSTATWRPRCSSSGWATLAELDADRREVDAELDETIAPWRTPRRSPSRAGGAHRRLRRWTRARAVDPQRPPDPTRA
jgi:TPP-dependent pyruvate/acetoin dehydrogenase alpha subunit